MTWIKRLFVFGITLIGVYTLFVTVMVMSPSISDYFDRTDFESSAWINWDDTESTQKMRWNMINDLTNNYKLIGMQKDEVKKLLGTPSSEYKNKISYYLGMTGRGINTGSLSLKFKDDIVINYNVHQG